MALSFGDSDLTKLAVGVVLLLVNHYGRGILRRLDRLFKRKPLTRAERRRRERAKRKKKQKHK